MKTHISKLVALNVYRPLCTLNILPGSRLFEIQFPTVKIWIGQKLYFSRWSRHNFSKIADCCINQLNFFRQTTLKMSHSFTWVTTIEASHTHRTTLNYWQKDLYCSTSTCTIPHPPCTIGKLPWLLIAFFLQWHRCSWTSFQFDTGSGKDQPTCGRSRFLSPNREALPSTWELHKLFRNYILLRGGGGWACFGWEKSQPEDSREVSWGGRGCWEKQKIRDYRKIDLTMRSQHESTTINAIHLINTDYDDSS